MSITVRLLADENFNGAIVRGLLRRNPEVDVVRVQDVGLTGSDDPTVLEWAAHDVWILKGVPLNVRPDPDHEALVAGRPQASPQPESPQSR